MVVGVSSVWGPVPTSDDSVRPDPPAAIPSPRPTAINTLTRDDVERRKEEIKERLKGEAERLEPPPLVHPAVAADAHERVATAVAYYERVWPWVGEAWELADLVVYDGQASPCPGAAACVNIEFGSGVTPTLHYTLRALAAEEWHRILLHELGHVWVWDADLWGDDEWKHVRAMWEDHYAGCRSSHYDSDQLPEERLVDAMAIAAGADLTSWLPFGRPVAERLDGCLAGSTPTEAMMVALRGVLYDCASDLGGLREEAMQEHGFMSVELRRVGCVDAGVQGGV